MVSICAAGVVVLVSTWSLHPIVVSCLLRICKYGNASIHEDVLELIIKAFDNLGKSLIAASHFVKRAVAVEVGLPGAAQQRELVQELELGPAGFENESWLDSDMSAYINA